MASSVLNVRLDEALHKSLRVAANKIGMETSSLARELLFFGLISLDTSKRGKVTFKDKPKHIYSESY